MIRAILATRKDPAVASMKLQATISNINDWAKKWGTKTDQSKSTHITFTLRNQSCQTMQIGNVSLPLPRNEVKYLGMRLDRRLIWVKHIKTNRKQLNRKRNRCTGYSEEDQH
jgi:hypothetical protein